MTQSPPRGGPAPVLVVGAGGSGLAAALELARGGASVRVVDAGAGPNVESRGNGLQARTLELLDLHGVTDTLVGLGNVVDALSVFSGSELLTEVDFRLAPSRFQSLVLPQCTTERVLRERLAQHGVEVEWGTRLGALLQHEAGVGVTLLHDDGPDESTGCAWLVGADGASSSVRGMLGLSFDGVSFEERWGLMDATLDWDLPGDRIRVFRARAGAGQLITVPLGGGRYRVQTDDVDRNDRAAPSLERMQELLDRYAAVPGTLSDPGWTSSFRVHCRQVVTYRHGRVFLVGDAAHIHTPAGGQGLNTGIQDGINLGWKLALVAGGHADAALLESYEQERFPVAAAVLQLTEALARNPASVATSRPEDAARIAAVVSQCAITYRDGPLATPGSGSGLQPGDRLPDLLVDGQHLHERLRPGRVVVAVLGGERTTAVPAFAHPVDVWSVDTESRDQPLAAALGCSEAIAVIRPDGYLGALAEGPDRVASTRGYLDEVLHLGPGLAGPSA